MARFKVQMTSVLWTFIEVDAEDESAAIDAAYEQAPVQICAQCSGWGRDFSIDQGEWEVPEDDAVEAVPDGE